MAEGAAEKAREGTETEETGKIPVEMMVLHQFTNRRLDELLLNLRKAGVPKIELKAVLTEHNSAGPFTISTRN